VSSVIEFFFNEIKNQYSTSIRVLHTDNVLEYVKKDVSSFCSKNEIIHQTSCSHTSQQNGVAERKHRHILVVTRTLMIHMSVPKYLWFDDVLSACYLINRMPSSILNKKFSILLSLCSQNPLLRDSPCFWMHLFYSGLVSWAR